MSKQELLNNYRLLMNDHLRLERFLSIVTKDNEMVSHFLYNVYYILFIIIVEWIHYHDKISLFQIGPKSPWDRSFGRNDVYWGFKTGIGSTNGPSKYSLIHLLKCIHTRYSSITISFLIMHLSILFQLYPI